MKYLSILIGAIVLASSVSAGAAEKKVYIQEAVFVGPESYTELVSGAPVIAKVHVTRSNVRGIPAGNATLPPNVYTEYTADIVDLYRGSARLGNRIAFMQKAGEIELVDRIIRVDDAEPLAAGTDYVVFLRYEQKLGAYVLVAERDAAFKVVRGVIVPQGTSDIAQERQNMPEKRFVTELQREIGRRPVGSEHQ